jgi:hypothetical protein
MWGFLGWLDDHSASSSESGRDLSSYHGSGEIPWGDNATDPDRLLDVRTVVWGIEEGITSP